MPRKRIGPPVKPRVNYAEEKAPFGWHEQKNRYNTFCGYRQEDVPEPGCSCVEYLGGLGYEKVKGTDTCTTYFQGKGLTKED